MGETNENQLRIKVERFIKNNNMTRRSEDKILFKGKRGSKPFNSDDIILDMMNNGYISVNEVSQVEPLIWDIASFDAVDLSKSQDPLIKLFNQCETRVFSSYNTETHHIANIDSWQDIEILPVRLTQVLEKEGLTTDEISSAMINKRVNAEFCYHPLNGLKMYHDVQQGTDKTFFNLYIPPLHLKQEKDIEGRMKQLVEDFFYHLFNNDEDSVEFVLDWLANSLWVKNRTFLTMIGAQGIGKGVFCDFIEKMVGPSNYAVGRQKDLDGSFNAHLATKQIVNFDEINLKEDNHKNTLKLMANDNMQIEGKGTNATTQQNYVSIVISSNELGNMEIKTEDRRFSIPDLVEVNLINADFIKEKWNDNTDSFIEALQAEAPYFWKYLRERGKKINRNMARPFVVKKRQDLIRFNSSKEWEKCLIEIVSYDMINKEDIKVEHIMDALELENGIKKPGVKKLVDCMKEWPRCFRIGGNGGKRSTVDILASFDGFKYSTKKDIEEEEK